MLYWGNSFLDLLTLFNRVIKERHQIFNSRILELILAAIYIFSHFRCCLLLIDILIVLLVIDFNLACLPNIISKCVAQMYIHNKINLENNGFIENHFPTGISIIALIDKK